MSQISRRSFLKGGIAAACATCASQVPLPASAKSKSGQELTTLIDIRKCVGCEDCVEACREVNDFKYPVPKKPFPKMYPNRVKVADGSNEEKREVRDRLTPYNWLTVQWATVEVDGEETELSFPNLSLGYSPAPNRCWHLSRYITQPGWQRRDVQVRPVL